MIAFNKYYNHFNILSIFLIIASLLLLIFKGLNYGIDFKGGTWMKKQEIQPVYTEPGKPMQNGYIERLNRTFREDVLDAYVFESVSQFNIIEEKWQDDYYYNHPAIFLLLC